MVILAFWNIFMKRPIGFLMLMESGRCSSMVDHLLLMVRWVVRSIRSGGRVELFLVRASAPQLVQQKQWYPVQADIYITELNCLVNIFL